MLEVLFGWRKASRCKKLIRRVQCRLKLLKSKRSSIVRQLRDDVAQLLKHGHEQNAFDRVEQIFLDESIVIVYDLLDQFCEFIIINLSYICKHRDCPSDIGEAVSTLIFASARCGDLPELRKIRKLFGERYGHKFASVALELLPGNLVNHQIKDNLSIKSVPDDVKLSLVDDIWRSFFQMGPLAIEYYPEIKQDQAIKVWEDEAVSSNIQSKYTINDDPQMQAFSVTEEDGKIVYVDSQSSYQKSSIDSTSTNSLMVINSSPSSTGLSINKYKGSSGKSSPYKNKITVKKEVESSSDTSSIWPKELVFIDDIEEYKSPVGINVNSQDRRLFMFKPLVIYPKLENDLIESYIDKNSSPNEKSRSRRFRKSKRQRRRSLSRESTSVKDFESAVYYGERDENSRKFNHRKKHQKKIPTYEVEKSRISKIDLSLGTKIEKNGSKNGGIAHECNLMQPCYLCTSDGVESKTITAKRFSSHSPGSLIIIEKDDLGKENGLRDIIGNACMKKEANYMRIMTMPPQRISVVNDENMVRSKSLPFRQPENGSKTCRHVHPKLPDYDELEATFKALKKANSQIKSK